MGTGVLYIVATPIGNMEDITLRAIRTLEEADLIVCEDTRITKRLLDRYGITAPAVSLYQSIRKGGSIKPILKLGKMVEELKSGKNIAFVSDAGTPGISDPGNQLVDKVMENGIMVIPIPGVSALTTLASVSGADLSRFVFLGFPPHKKGRETFFKEVTSTKCPVIYFESPHRLMKNLELLKTLAPDRRVILGRELTKMFEEIVRGSVGDIIGYFNENEDKIRGEIVIIVY